MIIFFDSSIMLRFGESKVAKEKLYGAKQKQQIFGTLMKQEERNI